MIGTRKKKEEEEEEKGGTTNWERRDNVGINRQVCGWEGSTEAPSHLS